MIGIGSGLLRPTQQKRDSSSACMRRTHKRESSLSTNTSTTSSQSRVMPFATASTRAMRIAPPIGEEEGYLAMAAIAEHPPFVDGSLPPPPQMASMASGAGLEKRESLPTITINGAATATASGQTYYPALGHPRFALAKPRRVITVNGAIASSSVSVPAVQPRQQQQQHKHRKVRASISLNSMLPPIAEPKRHLGSSSITEPKRHMGSSSSISNGSSSSLGGSRTRPIIGLGLTLNPADALVTIQPRSQRRALRTKVPKMLTPVRSSGFLETKCTHIAWSPVPEDYAEARAERHQSEALLDKAFKSVSFESLRSNHSDSSSINGDPRLVALSSNGAKKETAAVACQEEPAGETIQPEQLTREQLLSQEDLPGAKKLAWKSRAGELPVAVTCILCFERVLLSQKRSYLLRCPGCGNGLERPREKPSIPQPAEPWSLPSTLRSQPQTAQE
ncbi:hypothetical protein EV175_000210 [Coemansia sp. RSA 1933]|nr:hypothetical protein EV175_000210 [Coemansia sp. RSA 1933]